ncbi:MAG: alpha-L-rhamnosidase [Clostridiales bacterium]|nr:alpha-L-rhamnosidase [Clostridiales bacterium]
MKQLLLPKKIVSANGVENVRALYKKQPLTPVLRWDEGWESQIARANVGATLLLDFGKEMHGGIRMLLSRAKNGTKARIRFGESVGETYAELGEKNATNDHSPRDITVELSAFSDLTFGQTGFRFVKIDFLSGGECCLQNVFCENQIFAGKMQYRYQGTDKEIAQIFNAAKRTVDLCASTPFVWDGVKRDRLVWVGDLHPEMLALTTLYGKIPQIERSLTYIKNQTPLPAWMNGYPAYSLWWIIVLADYVRETGALTYAQGQKEYLLALVSFLGEHVSQTGELSFPDYFLDWPTCGTPDAKEGVQALALWAMQKAEYLLSALNENPQSATEIKRRLQAYVRKPTDKKQVIAIRYMATGNLTEGEYQTLIKGGAKGLSTFTAYYILKAIASKNPQTATQIMKEYYGGMLSLGATTFWEDFNVEWLSGSAPITRLPKTGERDIHGDHGAFCYQGFRHSLCHGWSAGVIKFIKEYCF